MPVLQLGYNVVEFRPLAGDAGEVELSLRCGEPESRPIGPEGRKANRRPVDVSSQGAVRRFLHDQYVTFFVGVTNVGYCRVACE